MNWVRSGIRTDPICHRVMFAHLFAWLYDVYRTCAEMAAQVHGAPAT